MNAKTILADLRAAASDEKRAALPRFFKSGPGEYVNVITRSARQNNDIAISKSSFYMSGNRAGLLFGILLGKIAAL